MVNTSADNKFQREIGKSDCPAALVRDALKGELGYVRGPRLHSKELNTIRKLVTDHFVNRLRHCVAEQAYQYADIGIDRYHELPPAVEHPTLWPKSARILPTEDVAVIREMSLFSWLHEIWGDFSISDEENVGWEEIYWRIVRPNESSDVGPLHADAWFWKLGHGVTPADHERIKVWMGIYCEPGRNGLRVVPGSHLREWRYHGVKEHGKLKPRIDEDEETLLPQLVPLEPGEAIVFNDRLLHGGAVNRGDRTRVSIEFTMFVRRQS